MLSDKARMIFEYLQNRSMDAVPPTVREICRDLGIKSTSTAHKYIGELVENGLIQKAEGQNRTIRLTAAGGLRVSVLGTIAAGKPITAIEQIENYILFSGYQGSASDLFALHVRGESMIEAGILDGDLIIVRKTPVAENGEIVVALIDDEATVKRFYKENGCFRLQPENSQMEPIIVDQVVILGRVIAVIRSYE